MLRLRFAPLSMTGADAHVVMLSEAKNLIPLYCRVLRGKRLGQAHERGAETTPKEQAQTVGLVPSAGMRFSSSPIGAASEDIGSR